MIQDSLQLTGMSFEQCANLRDMVLNLPVSDKLQPYFY